MTLRYRDGGTWYTVAFSRDDYDDWRRGRATWSPSGLFPFPCAPSMPTKRGFFQFDRRNGALVDMAPTDDWDGDAIVAFSADVQAWAQAWWLKRHPAEAVLDWLRRQPSPHGGR